MTTQVNIPTEEQVEAAYKEAYAADKVAARAIRSLTVAELRDGKRADKTAESSPKCHAAWIRQQASSAESERLFRQARMLAFKRKEGLADERALKLDQAANLRSSHAELLACLVSAMSVILDPSDPEIHPNEFAHMSEYQKEWNRLFCIKARTAIEAVGKISVSTKP